MIKCGWCGNEVDDLGMEMVENINEAAKDGKSSVYFEKDDYWCSKCIKDLHNQFRQMQPKLDMLMLEHQLSIFGIPMPDETEF